MEREGNEVKRLLKRERGLIIGKQANEVSNRHPERFFSSVCVRMICMLHMVPEWGDLFKIRKGTFKHCNVYSMSTTEYRHIHRTHRNELFLFLQAKAGIDRTVQITWYFVQRIHSVDSFRQVNIRSFLCSTHTSLERNF